PDTQAERISVVTRFLSGHHEDEPAARILVLCTDSLDEQVPSPQDLDSFKKSLELGMQIGVETLLQELESSGYERVPTVAERGQFARRGGIVDVFSWQGEEPLRIEFFDDAVESLRAFDIHTQTSVKRFERVSLLLHQVDTGAAATNLRTLVTARDAVVTLECDPAFETQASSCQRIFITSGAVAADTPEDFSTAVFENPLGMFEAGDFVLHEARRSQFTKQVEEWRGEHWRIVMFLHNEGERERFEELAGREWIAQHGIELTLGLLHRGFVIPSAKLAVLTGAEIFGRHLHTRRVRGSKLDEAQVLRQARDHLREMREGDLVVHEQYGIGRFTGIEVRGAGDRREEVMVLRYADDSKLFVPVAQAHLVSRYVGVGGKAPLLNKLGDARWTKTRANAERSVEEFAARMLSIAAQRTTLKGHAHPPDTKWQVEFEQSFLYRETPDQLRSIEEIKRDMELEKPMDRLLCGDVGFGKTEVAIRAAFKVVQGGKQVAILVPTTILAQQHLNTFRERMAGYPIAVEMVSRFRTKGEVNRILHETAAGQVDILIGTHALLTDRVAFKDLGLVIVDEEQRFGVKHKERLKAMRTSVDILSMSATPIPRTLYMAMTGARDMSVIETAPVNRHPIQTIVKTYDEKLVVDAIRHELRRGGQVFYLHNRVQTINLVAARLREMLPDVTIGVGHGQMDEHELEREMTDFVAGKHQVLVCTTIIETGLDIPNCNTIIIEGADRFGLSQLYQLRGRVGRFKHQAYAYLLLHRHTRLVEITRERLNALRTHNQLGAGFRIAMRDLELRGAGNLLGSQQSGHIIGVGFELYCQLLRQSVARLKGDKQAAAIRANVKLDFVFVGESAASSQLTAPSSQLTSYQSIKAAEQSAAGAVEVAKIQARIPSAYITETRLRIDFYRRLAMAGNPTQLKEIESDFRDRFGKFSDEVRALLLITEIRIRAEQAGIISVETDGSRLKCLRGSGIRDDYVMLAGSRFPRLTAPKPLARLKEILTFLGNL
ncbi:MAG: transcription-repair coupling factor, partial [Rariglobus sp.]